jgi:hypothetical protein
VPKKLLAIAAMAVLVALANPAAASAAAATGVLTVTATPTGSIFLVFNSDPAGVVLGGTGTRTASLAFGAVSAFPIPAGTCPTVGVTCVGTFANVTASSPFDVFVFKSNLTSANYTLTAALGTADAVNTWTVGATTLTTTAATLGATFAYATNNPLTLNLAIPNTVTAAISNTINFTATSN